MPVDKLVLKSKQKSYGEYRTFSIRVEKSIAGEIEKLAIATGRSRNDIVQIMLEYSLNHCEVKKTDTAE